MCDTANDPLRVQVLVFKRDAKTIQSMQAVNEELRKIHRNIQEMQQRAQQQIRRT